VKKHIINTEKIVEIGLFACICAPKKVSGTTKLNASKHKILLYFDNNAPRTLKQAAAWIRKEFDIKVSSWTVSRFFKENGIKRRKTISIPSKSNPAAQRAFLDDALMPLIENAKKGISTLFFVDASHFVQGFYPSYVWSRIRAYVPSSSGRRRYNVLGALNFASKVAATVTNDKYINAASVIELFDKLLLQYPGKIINIILDNARYQKCIAITDYIKLHPYIKLVYLPPYSPNLNLIERLWRHVKSEALNSAYIDSFEEFCKKIDACLEETHKSKCDVINSLITEKFQLFDNKDALSNAPAA
jgi:transposase